MRMKAGDPLLIWVWQLQLSTALCHFWVDLAIRGSELWRDGGGKEQPVSEYEHRIIPCINNSSLPAPIGFAHFSPGDAREPIERKEEKKTIAGIQQPTRTREGAVPKGCLSAARKWQAMIYPPPMSSAVSGRMLASQRKKLTSCGGGICNAVNTRHDRARTQKTTAKIRALLLHFYFATATPSFLAQTAFSHGSRSPEVIMRRADSNFQGEVGTNSKRSGKKSGEATDVDGRG